jgi:hypothetical protein
MFDTLRGYIDSYAEIGGLDPEGASSQGCSCLTKAGSREGGAAKSYADFWLGRVTEVIPAAPMRPDARRDAARSEARRPRM